MHRLFQSFSEVICLKKGRTWVQNLLTEMDFPAEILTGAPVVEIKGRAEAAVLNHRGIISYDEAEVLVASSMGPVRVAGSDLRIFRMNRERIQIHGTVRRVEIGGDA